MSFFKNIAAAAQTMNDAHRAEFSRLPPESKYHDYSKRAAGHFASASALTLAPIILAATGTLAVVATPVLAAGLAVAAVNVANGYYLAHKDNTSKEQKEPSVKDFLAASKNELSARFTKSMENLGLIKIKDTPEIAAQKELDFQIAFNEFKAYEAERDDAIARTFAVVPPLAQLDEPTHALENLITAQAAEQAAAQAAEQAAAQAAEQVAAQAAYVDYIEDGKVTLLTHYESSPENSFETKFSNLDEIENFSSAHPELPVENKDSMIKAQLDLLQQSVNQDKGSAEAKYSIFARHAELENTLVSGGTPTVDYFKDLAVKDSLDIGYLSEKDALLVQPDIDLAKSISPDYSDVVSPRENSISENLPEKNMGVSDKELNDLRMKLSANNEASTAISKSQVFSSNAISVARSGNELAKEQFLMPRKISENYNENNGEFYRKDSNALAFRESKEGNSLHTSTFNKDTVADMIDYAKAKQWSELKLNGSKAFRQEAWLQAESQGIKTAGYTPTKDDIGKLAALSKERATNSIENVSGLDKTAPRLETVRETASTVVGKATFKVSENLLDLRANPAYSGYSESEILKVAELRSFAKESMAAEGKTAEQQASFVAKFDKTMSDPSKLELVAKMSQSAEPKEKEHEISAPKQSRDSQISL